MTSSARRYSAESLGAVTRAWGYQPMIRASAADRGDSAVLSHGALSTIELPCGLRVCWGDLTVAREHNRSAVMSRSLAIIVALSGEGERYCLENRTALEVRPGESCALSAADDLVLSGHYKAGQHSVSLVLNAVPERMTDAELAERLSAVLRGTSVRPICPGLRPHWLAKRSLLHANLDVVDRLRLESCALELLADALDRTDSSDPRPHNRLSPPEVQAIRRVQDYLLATPERVHSLPELAALAGMSLSTFKRKFRLATTQSVFEFVRATKLARARHGLLREGWTVKQAAWAAGYRHPTNFAAAYRRCFGVAPGRQLT